MARTAAPPPSRGMPSLVIMSQIAPAPMPKMTRLPDSADSEVSVRASQVAASRGDGGHLGRRLIAVRALAGGLVSGTLRLPQGLNPLLAVEQPGGLGLL